MDGDPGAARPVTAMVVAILGVALASVGAVRLAGRGGSRRGTNTGADTQGVVSFHHGIPVAPGSSRRSGGPPARHVVALAAGAGALGTAVVAGWVPVVVGTVAAVAGRAAVVRLRARRREAARIRAIPDLVDLFGLAAAAGLPVAAALHAVAPRAPAPVRAAIHAASANQRRGLSVAEVLARLRRDLGARGEALVDALADAARSGTPLVPTLANVAAVVHRRRAADAEEAARRLPVTLLFPLACCILPAAVLLALVPVLLVSVGSLRA